MAESEKRLQFLLSLMEIRRVSKHELARIMGVSPQNIFVYFKRDDMKLSVAQEMASRLGYDLSYRLVKEDGPARDVVLDIEGLVGKDGLQRLAFLRVAMGQYGIERKALAEQLDLNYTGVNRWFKVDDIALSYLYKIAEFMTRAKKYPYSTKDSLLADIYRMLEGICEKVGYTERVEIPAHIAKFYGLPRFDYEVSWRRDTGAVIEGSPITVILAYGYAKSTYSGEWNTDKTLKVYNCIVAVYNDIVLKK